MKRIILIGLIFISMKTIAQDYAIDSLENWSYDILDKEIFIKRMNDNSLIDVIVIFRNQALEDEKFDEKMAKRPNYSVKGFRPNMTFFVYPKSMIAEIEKKATSTKMLSSCMPPSVGGDYYITEDYILFNYSSCVQCTYSSNSKLDLCRKNIENILKRLENKSFNSITDFYNALPINKQIF